MKKKEQITEEAVCRYHCYLIKKSARKAWGLELDDAVDAAWIGFLFAIRTWRGDRYEFFLSYAKECIRAEIERIKRMQDKQRRIQASCSLDMPLSNKNGTASLGDLIAVARSDKTIEDVRWFRVGLNPIMNRYIQLRLDDFPDWKIARILKMSRCEVDVLRGDVQSEVNNSFERT